MKNIFSVVIMLFLMSFVVACTEVVREITIDVNEDSISIKEGETFQLDIETNDEQGYDIEVINQSIANVSDQGLVTALGVGSTTIQITSKSDQTKFIVINLVVRKVVALALVEPTDLLWVGNTLQLEFESNDDVTFESSQVSIASVSSTGLVTALTSGNVTITMKSVSDTTVFDSIDLVIYDVVDTIVLSGETKSNVGTKRQLNVNVAPDNALPEVTFSSSDQLIATVDQLGEVTFINSGVVTITATAISSDKSSTLNITVVNEIIVDQSKVLDDVVDMDGLSFIFGERLFTNIDDALEHASKGTTIKLYDGTYSLSKSIDFDDISIKGMSSLVQINNKLEINASNVVVDNINFIEFGMISLLETASNVEILNNDFTNLDSTVLSAILVSDAKGLNIFSNTFTTSLTSAIKVNQFSQGNIEIHKNIVNAAKDAIVIAGDQYDTESKLHITRNELQNVDSAFTILLDETEIEAYVRFNSVAIFNNFLAESSELNQVDFTLNHWGMSELNMTDFKHIPKDMLLGHYEAKADIIKEADYNPLVPVKIFITSQIDQLWVNQNQMIQYMYLPYELEGARLRFITSDSNILMVQSSGMLEPRRSGSATITVRSSVKSSIATSVVIDVTTDPGIDITPSIKEQGILIGTPLKIDATPFPVTLKDEAVIYESSDNLVATIDAEGNVTSTGAGSVTFSVKLASDPMVSQSYTVTFYESLDENNLLDLLTQNQVSYTEEYSYMAIGNGYSYSTTLYESVSKYYFGNIEVNTSKMVPVSTGIRPGILKPNHPAGVTTYNPENVYWLVIHDTANTSTGSGALSHANYLYNAAMAGTVLNTSWTYTMDDSNMYQHVPENEVSYHAGDGSVLPGQSATYLGGGNRNGIAIEMSVADDDDTYRVWQRTAKFAAQALVRYNLPRTHMKYHRDFSGKICPNTLINSGLLPYFEMFGDVEYKVAKDHGNAQITLTSGNPEILDNMGRIISMPDHATTVSYTINIVEGNIQSSRTFQVYVPGTIR